MGSNRQRPSRVIEHESILSLLERRSSPPSRQSALLSSCSTSPPPPLSPSPSPSPSSPPTPPSILSGVVDSIMSSSGKHVRSVNPRMRLPFRALPRLSLRRASVPLVSALKHVGLAKESPSGHALVFLLKVAALEAVRRGSLALNIPSIWWGIQGLSMLHVPPLKWLQSWHPLKRLIQGSEAFSKPLLFLSMASSALSLFTEHREISEYEPIDEERRVTRENQVFGEDEAIETLPVLPAQTVREEVDSDNIDICAKTLQELNRELDRAGIFLPERINRDELERFVIASNLNVRKSLSMVRKTIQWREQFYFLTPHELEAWSHLVFWHGRDKHGRPCLIIRLGIAFTLLKSDDRPRFVQAVLSQIEYGVLNLLLQEDQRMTVIVDCQQIRALRFPVNMLKSCAVLMQEHYPSRLAALFAVNLPPFVRVISHAIIQVLKPATREKIHVEGHQFALALAEHHGGAGNVPLFLSGSCQCSHCQRLSSSGQALSAMSLLSHSESESENESSNHESELSESENEWSESENESSEVLLADPWKPTPYYRTHAFLLRLIVVGLVVLWAIASLAAGFYDPLQGLS